MQHTHVRWADLMHTDQILVDRDEDGDIAFLEGHTSTDKTMRSSLFKHRFLPLIAPTTGVTNDCWAGLWLDSRKKLGNTCSDACTRHQWYSICKALNFSGGQSMVAQAAHWVKRGRQGPQGVYPQLQSDLPQLVWLGCSHTFAIRISYWRGQWTENGSHVFKRCIG